MDHQNTPFFPNQDQNTPFFPNQDQNIDEPENIYISDSGESSSGEEIDDSSLEANLRDQQIQKKKSSESKSILLTLCLFIGLLAYLKYLVPEDQPYLTQIEYLEAYNQTQFNYENMINQTQEIYKNHTSNLHLISLGIKDQLEAVDAVKDFLLLNQKELILEKKRQRQLMKDQMINIRQEYQRNLTSLQNRRLSRSFK